MTDRVYKTSDQGFATYLWVKGFAPFRAVPANELNPRTKQPDPRRKAFVFAEFPEDVDKMQRDFDNFTTDLISPKEFAQKWKATTRMARDAVTQEELDQLRG